MADSTRVILVKPGDVLMFGNVTIPDDSDVLTSIIEQLKCATGVKLVAFFEDDIDMAAIPSG